MAQMVFAISVALAHSLVFIAISIALVSILVHSFLFFYVYDDDMDTLSHSIWRTISKGLNRQKIVERDEYENEENHTCAVCSSQENKMVEVSYADTLKIGTYKVKEYNSGSSVYCPFHGEPAWEVNTGLVNDKRISTDDKTSEIVHIKLLNKQKACLEYLIDYALSNPNIHPNVNVEALRNVVSSDRKTHKVSKSLQRDILILSYGAHEHEEWFHTSQQQEQLRNLWSTIYTQNISLNDFKTESRNQDLIPKMVEQIFNIELKQSTMSKEELFETSPTPVIEHDTNDNGQDEEAYGIEKEKHVQLERT